MELKEAATVTPMSDAYTQALEAALNEFDAMLLAIMLTGSLPLKHEYVDMRETHRDALRTAIAHVIEREKQ